MLDKEELEKFWKYFGFTRSHSKRAFHWSYGYKEQHWLEPSGKVTEIHGLSGRLPPLDMNAIEKWVWPELKKRKLRIEYFIDTDEDWGRDALHNWSILKGTHYLVGQAEGKEMAETLKEALRPLWDKEAE